MKRAILSDVADEAGVSLAAASLALSGKGRISPEVRERVTAVARRLGYDRHVAARKRRGRYVGVLYNEEKTYEWGFIRPIMTACEELLLTESYAPIVIPIRRSQTPDEIYDVVVFSGIKGVISVQYYSEDLFKRLAEAGIPVVLSNKSSTKDLFDSVAVDDFQGAYEGARYLCELGHRQFAYVEYERPDFATLQSDRFIGFKKALDESGISFPPEQRITVPAVNEVNLQNALEATLKSPTPTTAIFAHDDFLAAYVVTVAARLGYRFPDDISLLAPGDVLDYSYPWIPQITTMRINTDMIGRITTNLLLDRLRGNLDQNDSQALRVKQQLVIRSTCRSRA